MQRQIVGRLNIQGTLALAGVIGPIALLIGNYVPALTTTGYSLIRDSISSLALTPLGWVLTIGFLCVGLLIEIYVAALLFSIKPVIYGSFAARVLNIPVIVMITGLGTAFIQDNWLTRVAQTLYRIALKWPDKIFFQNKDDKHLFISKKMARAECKVQHRMLFITPIDSSHRDLSIGALFVFRNGQ